MKQDAKAQKAKGQGIRLQHWVTSEDCDFIGGSKLQDFFLQHCRLQASSIQQVLGEELWS
jgi:hypothetical protein